MTDSVDDKIVEMKFNNKQFEQGVNTTLATLEKLKKSLDFQNANKSFGELERAGSRFTMGNMGTTIEGINTKLAAMATIGITALAQITTSALHAGTQLAKSLTIDPVKAGLDEYELKLQAIQTIMAGTGENIGTVTDKLQELNDYSDKTIYSFADMTQNIGKFTNAGVELDTAVKAIQGVAQVAAVSGATTDQAAHSMYNFGQAIGQGYVGLVDWKSIDIAGMGTAEFKQQLIDSAVAMGTLKKNGDGTFSTMKGNIVTTKNFTQSLRDQWLTSDALISTLNRYSDPTTAIGKKAFEAAQNVKTLSQAIDIARESAGSGWATTWELLFGNLEEATKTFTALSNVISGFIQRSAEARNKVLKDWAALGGRAALFKGIGNIFEALMAVLKPIKDAFRDIFPAKTGQDLFRLTRLFRKFTESLIISDETAALLRRSFAGVFAIFDIARRIVGDLLGLFTGLFDGVGEGGNGFLNLTAAVGDFLVSLDEALKSGDGLKSFFSGLGRVLSIPIKLLSALAELMANLLSGFDGSGAREISSTVAGMAKSFSPLEIFANRVKDAFSGILDFFGRVVDAMRPFTDVIVQAFSGIGEVIANAFSGDNFDKTLDVINTALFAGITGLLYKFSRDGLSFGVDLGGGLFENIRESFSILTGSLQAMQNNIKADTLLKIAGAVGLLAVSIVLLSGVDSGKLTVAMAGITGAFAQLLGGMAVLALISGSAGFVKIPIIAGSLILLSIAVLTLSVAVRAMAGLDWNELAKGLSGVTGVLAALVASSLTLSASGMIRSAFGIAVISGSMLLLAGAMKIFATMSWAEIAKGLVSLAGSLVVIAFSVALIPASIFLVGPGLIAFAGGLTVLAGAMKLFGDLSWAEIGKGLVAMAGGLILIGIAVALIPATIVLIGPGLIAVATGLTIMAGALKIMGSMSWKAIGKSMVVLGGSLLILAAGLTAMIFALPGAAALVVAAGALAILTPVLVTLGTMSWEAIAKGLAAIAGVLIILGVASFVLAPVIPAMIGLAGAILLLGVGMLAAGGGMMLFATALGLLATTGAAGLAVLTAAVVNMADLLPYILGKLAEGVVAFAEIIGQAGPALTGAFTTLLSSMLDSTIELAPKLGEALVVVVTVALAVLRDTWPKWVNTAFYLLDRFLFALRERMPGIVTIAIDLIALFIWILGLQSPKLVDAAFKAIIVFIDGLSDAIDANAEALGAAGGRLAKALGAGVVNGLKGYVGEVFGSAEGLAQSALNGLMGKWRINSPSKASMELAEGLGEGVVIGINAYDRQVGLAAESVAETALTAMSDTMARIREGFSAEVDLTPVITPVLDLTTMRSQALGISGAFGAPTIMPTVSISQADEISAALAASREDDDEPPKGGDIIFQQHNTSPEALDATEIYRNTKSQLAMAKEALSQT